MKAMFISGSILAITGLLLLLRSLLVRGTSERPEYHRVYLMSFDDGGDDEWPSLIGSEEAPASNGTEPSEDERHNSSKLNQSRVRSASSSRSY